MTDATSDARPADARGPNQIAERGDRRCRDANRFSARGEHGIEVWIAAPGSVSGAGAGDDRSYASANCLCLCFVCEWRAKDRAKRSGNG